MSDVRIAVEKMVRSAGLTPTFTGSLSVSNTYQVNNNGKVYLHFKKSGSSDCVVTVVTTRSYDGNAVADYAGTTVPATTGEKIIGPFDPGVYNILGGHDLEFTLSNIAGVTVAAIQMAE